tara:strand:+ start:79140 stop:79643 length:504 start_codon:yes stop_codon:yes gene_type:complete
MANNEWGTPQQYIESARKVMGSIDTDPASNDQAQLIVQAGTYYTKKRSGLGAIWSGNVWLNPPYGRGEALPFCKDLADNYRIGFTVQAIVLTNNVPDTTWWSSTVGQHCSAICQLDHRIAFINPETGLPERGNDRNQLFAYLGDNVDAFIAEFSQYGLCSVPVRLAA